jgi:hypothetical protein
MPTVYRKTAKGVVEIGTRSHGLTPRERNALIVVDGKRNSDELHALIALNPQQTLENLAAQGFIEPIAEAVPPAAPPRHTAAAAPTKSFFEAQRGAAVRAFTELMGPVGDGLALRMERARSAQELQPLVAMAVYLIGNERGRSQAQAYAALFQDKHDGAQGGA